MSTTPLVPPSPASVAPVSMVTGQHVRLTVALSVLGIFVTYLPIGGVAVALSAIRASTGSSTSDLQWVSDAYTIPMAAAVLSAGVFGDLFGRRRLFILGMALTTVGALGAGCASLAGAAAIVLLWVGQAVSGLGAGLLLPTTLALIVSAVHEPKARSRYVALWATGMSAALALGPLISGTLLRIASWGVIFAPIGLLALVAGAVAYGMLPESPKVEGRHLDWPGQITASVAIAATIFGVIEGGSQGWASALAIAGLTVGGLAIVAFIGVESRMNSPMLDLSLFRIPAYAAAGFAALTALFSVVGSMFLLSLFFGSVQHLDAFEIGIRLLFVTGVATVANQFSGRFLHRIQPVWMLGAGLLVSGAAIYLLTDLDASSQLGAVAWRLAIFGVAFSMIVTPMSVVAIDAAPREKASMASSGNTVLRQCGSALGPAVLGAILSGRIAGGGTYIDGLHTAFLATSVLLAVAALGCIAAGISGQRTAG